MVDGKTIASMDDWELLNDYATRNSEDAFRLLVEHHAAPVYQTAFRQTGNHHLAEEITQAVFIVLARKAGKIRRGTPLAGWLFRATRFAIANQIRNETRRKRREQEASLMDAHEPTDGDLPSVSDRISALMNDALAGLSKSDREALLIRFFQNKSHRELAEMLGVTEAAAKVRVSRALERLRLVFARRGTAVAVATLAGILSSSNAGATPVGLTAKVTAAALGNHATAGSLALAKGISNLMSWSTAKAAILAASGILLAAAVTTGVVLNSGGTKFDDVIGKLEHESGRRIAWDKRLSLPTEFAVQESSFEQKLDQIAVAAGAYWTVDYAVYDSDHALRHLVTAIHEGEDLSSAGWTNLSSRKLEPVAQIAEYRGAGGIRLGSNSPANVVGMVVVLDRETSAMQQQKFEAWISSNRLALQNNQPREGAYPGAEIQATIRTAMADGIEDGILAPERLLTESDLLPKLSLALPENATADNAKRLARNAKLKSITIYTLRKSPVEGGGIKLMHAGDRFVSSRTGVTNFFTPNPEAILKQVEKNQTTLSADERAAHERAVRLQKQTGASNSK